MFCNFGPLLIKRMDLDSILKKHQILPGHTKLIDIGCVQLSATRNNEGWHLITSDNCPHDDIDLNAESSLSDYFQTGKSNSLVIAPALPAKPLVFKGSGLNVLPDNKITFFLKIPLAFQIYFSKIQPENLLKEITYKRLSDTWFGDPDSGEPAFSLGSDYFLDIGEIKITDELKNHFNLPSNSLALSIYLLSGYSSIKVSKSSVVLLLLADCHNILSSNTLALSVNKPGVCSWT